MPCSGQHFSVFMFPHFLSTLFNDTSQRITSHLVFSCKYKIEFSEPVSKRFSLFKVKEGEDFNHRNTLSISRIKI